MARLCKFKFIVKQWSKMVVVVVSSATLLRFDMGGLNSGREKKFCQIFAPKMPILRNDAKETTCFAIALSASLSVSCLVSDLEFSFSFSLSQFVANIFRSKNKNLNDQSCSSDG